jgi:hypothetical protein
LIALDVAGGVAKRSPRGRAVGWLGLSGAKPLTRSGLIAFDVAGGFGWVALLKRGVPLERRSRTSAQATEFSRRCDETLSRASGSNLNYKATPKLTRSSIVQCPHGKSVNERKIRILLSRRFVQVPARTGPFPLHGRVAKAATDGILMDVMNGRQNRFRRR